MAACYSGGLLLYKKLQINL